LNFTTRSWYSGSLWPIRRPPIIRNWAKLWNASVRLVTAAI
jgi:hypothetical protein